MTIEIPVHDAAGKQIDQLKVDAQLLGGELRLDLLKQAYVRLHANQRQGTASTRNRSRVKGSRHKIYRQKGTGNARHGDCKANLMRGGGHAHAKKAVSWRQQMPIKMRRLANRNALLAKVIDGEVKLVDKFAFDKPNTKQFTKLLGDLGIERTCLVALESNQSSEARSAGNLEHVSVTRVDRLNAFDLLNHRYLLVEKDALLTWIEKGAVVSSRAQLPKKEAG